jgi:hypothetical protein
VAVVAVPIIIPAEAVLAGYYLHLVLLYRLE